MYIVYCIYIYNPVDFPTDVRETIWCIQKRKEAKSTTAATYIPTPGQPFYESGEKLLKQ